MDIEMTLLFFILALVPYTLSKNNSYSNLFFKKGQKPRFSCTVNQNADYLMRNHMKWERHSNHGQPEVLSRLGNIENGLEKNYSVSIQSTKSWVEFHLEFLQELDEDFGFLQCVLYNSFHEILQIQQVGVFVAPPDEKHLEFEKIGANGLIAGQKSLDESPADKHIAESSVEIHIFLERSEIVNVPVTKANGNPPRITKQLIPFIMNSNTPKILDVHYVAYPPAVVMWYINCSSSNPVKLTKHITTAATRSYLKFKNIHSESSTCIILVRIQNMHGVKESKTVLLVGMVRHSLLETPRVNFTLEKDPILGESVIMTCITSIVHGNWLISRKINNTNCLIFSNEILSIDFSSAKYNLTIIEYNTLKFEIKECSVNDVTVYTCICSDEIDEKNYEDDIDLRDYINLDMDVRQATIDQSINLDGDVTQRTPNQSTNEDGNDSSNPDTTIWVIIACIVGVIVFIILIAAVYKKRQYIYAKLSELRRGFNRQPKMNGNGNNETQGLRTTEICE